MGSVAGPRSRATLRDGIENLLEGETGADVTLPRSGGHKSRAWDVGPLPPLIDTIYLCRGGVRLPQPSHLL